ncbi:MAG: type I-E CRISPR-associated protein Cas7/Cse4/CasC [Oscillospiraceae bacterium]|jgi:CRISPR system Cascade subunit CasC|nr:type I-E CRISPR-associated protein Cas7/Cse4/CasC [Oscillospiraceae bacterium]
MNNNRLYIDIHILQTVPPSCINRDDVGAPKTAVYGGVTRARVSSQSWKKAVRDIFSKELAENEVGVRTKRIADMVAKEIYALNPEYDKTAVKTDAEKVLQLAGLQEKSTKAGKDAPLFFMSVSQAKALAKLVVEDEILKSDAKDMQKKKGTDPKAQKALTDNPAIDVALFGRMVADDPGLNTDATTQVAHAISTHKVENEFDYFTAVDDFPAEEKTDAGAGMIGTVEFNSSTLYRYATVAVHDLQRKLGAATAKAVGTFVDVFARAMPTGKQNTFANRTIPDAVLVTIRGDQPVNFVGAFENPVKPKNGYFAGSVEQLIKKVNETYSDWLAEPEKSFVVGAALGAPDVLAALGTTVEKVKLDALAKKIEEYLNDHTS